MKLKRAIATMCALALCVGSFAGCAKVEDASSAAPAAPSESTAESKAESGSEAAPEAQELNIAVFQGGYGREIWDQVAQKFEDENPGVTVNVTANAKLGDVIRPDIMSGNAPDFIYLASTNESGLLQSLITDKALTDISDVFDDELKEKMIPGSLTGPTITPYGDGKIYAAPLFYSVMGLWYDKNLFKTNGWEVPKTWDEFFALGDKAKEKGIGLFTYPAANAPGYNESVVWPTIAVAGGEQALQDVFNYKEGAWKADGVQQMMKLYEKIGKEGYLLNGTLAMNHTQSQQEYLQDKVLFMPNGAWIQGEMADAPKAEGFEYGFAGLPTFTADQTAYVWTASEEMYIPAKAKNPELAKKFMKFLYDEDTIKMMVSVTKAIPPVKGAVDLAKDVLDEATYDSFKATENGFTAVTGGFASTSQSEFNIRQDFFKMINDIMDGKLTVEDWTKKMEEMSAKLAPLVLNS